MAEEALGLQSWFEAGTVLDAIKILFGLAKAEIRMASGFFTLRGWSQIRSYTKGKRVYLLVGLEEPGEQRARAALIKEIMVDLRIGLHSDRRQAVADLVAKMESKTFEIFDARAQNHHAKLYLIDKDYAIVTSANISEKGLRKQIESGCILSNPAEVALRVADFDRYFALAYNLTEELLEILKRWLALASPWDVYLKTLLCLENLQPIPMAYKKQPLTYQQDMIAQSLRQIREHGGSMIVASTGLGKTVIATHIALHLKRENLIDNIIIIAPKICKTNWEQELQSACLPYVFFVVNILDQPSHANSHEVNRFLQVLKNDNQLKWLVIIDESQLFRNRYKDIITKSESRSKRYYDERRSFERLVAFVRQNDAKVLLLTGSPYATDVDNLNAQLFLLPHNAPNRSLFNDSQYADRSWMTQSAEDFVKLPVVSKLTTPHVARYYGHPEGEYKYIMYGNEKRFIPNIQLNNVIFPFYQPEIFASLVSSKILYLNSKHNLGVTAIERNSRIAWTSSFLALESILKKIWDTPGGENAFRFSKSGRGTEFIFSQKARQEAIKELLADLQKQTYYSDYKLQILIGILQDIKKQREKAIIYCERRATVVYLKRALAQLLPNLKTLAIVEQTDEYNYELKESKEIERMIKQFAPKANKVKDIDSTNWDLFISTDAGGIGVNMQDASTIINYDIDWTPINPIQRAGRVLRPWDEPRIVNIYTFLPDVSILKNYLPDSKMEAMGAIIRRWENLLDRHDKSTKIIDLPVLTEQSSENILMSEIAPQVEIQSVFLKMEDCESIYPSDVSVYYQHMAKLQKNRAYAESISSDIISTKTYNLKSPAIFVLVCHNNKYYGLIYHGGNKVEEPDPTKYLELISCEPNTPTAAIDPNIIEEWVHQCIEKWCQQKGIPPEEIARECAILLVPETQDAFQALF